MSTPQRELKTSKGGVVPSPGGPVATSPQKLSSAITIPAKLWSITVFSPTLTLKTKVNPAWTIQVALDHLKNKFPEDLSGYAMYFETDKNFLMLDSNSVINSIQELADEVEVYLYPKVWKGTSAKNVRVAVGIAKPNVEKPETKESLRTSIDPTTQASPKEKDHSEFKTAFDSFFPSLVGVCKEVLNDGKTLKGLLSGQEGATELVFAAAKKCAQTTVDLNDLVEKQTVFASYPQYTSVKDSSKAVRTAVLKLIQKSRSVATNPFDFLARSEFENTNQEVVDSIKNLIENADELQNEEERELNEKEDENITRDLVRATKELHSFLTILMDSVNSQDKSVFVATTRSLVLAMNQIMQIDETLKVGMSQVS